MQCSSVDQSKADLLNRPDLRGTLNTGGEQTDDRDIVGGDGCGSAGERRFSGAARARSSPLSLYQETETVGGHMSKAYRTEFDLETSARATYAVIRKSSMFDGSWKPVDADAKCRLAMHGGKSSLARVQLSPLSTDAQKMGDSFVDNCAPAGVFFPLTDILNVAMIPFSEEFRAAELTKIGESRNYPGFDAAFVFG